MKLFPAVALGLAFLCGAPRATRAGDASSLAAAENAFAQESVAHGMRTAFLHALSDDGIVFLPGPQNGKKAWTAAKESTAELAWHPALAVVAASGELGYTTGPWTYKKKGESAPGLFGQFVSVWRQEEGKWKLLFDLGAENPQPAESAAPLQTVDLPAPNDGESGATPEEFFERERSYREGLPGSFSAMAADDVRLLRDGKIPVLGEKGAAELLAKSKGPATFGDPKGGLSRRGDLAYAWGEYHGASDGYYLHIWRRNAAGTWQLALDLLHPR
ncbi:MAG: nuclear transport factor 2 family protein [Chthoniobacterales bacterium]